MKSELIINHIGDKFYYLNGQRHREDGPAVEYANRDKRWYINGKLHRTNGPAIEYYNGTKEWYYNGERINVKSQEEFERYIKLLEFQ